MPAIHSISSKNGWSSSTSLNVGGPRSPANVGVTVPTSTTTTTNTPNGTVRFVLSFIFGSPCSATDGRPSAGAGYAECVGQAAAFSRMWTPQARAETDDVGQADLGALDLAVAGLAAEVVADLPDVGDAGGRDRVALRLEPARHVHRRRPSRHVAPDSKKSTALALGAQHEVVVVHQLGGGEAVVQLDEVEVVGPTRRPARRPAWPRCV